MLILTRKLDEIILIGDNIRIKVTSLNADAVKIGIDAPKEIRIMREEIHPDRIRRTNGRRFSRFRPSAEPIS